MHGVVPEDGYAEPLLFKSLEEECVRDMLEGG